MFRKGAGHAGPKTRSPTLNDPVRGVVVITTCSPLRNPGSVLRAMQVETLLTHPEVTADLLGPTLSFSLAHVSASRQPC